MPQSILPKTILLVEDEALIAMTEAQMLKNHGYEVLTAYNAQKAIETVKENPIDLILMDIDLGHNKMDGTEAAEIILEEHDIPVVFLSSHTEPEIVEKTEGITSYGYIVKNSGDTVLLASLKMAFRLFEANQQIKQHEQELENTVEELRTTNENLIQKEEDLRKNNRALRTLSECNQVLVQETNESDLVQAICNVIVEKAGYRLCWIGNIEGEGKDRKVVPTASSGFEDGYLETHIIRVEEGPTSKGPTATAARTQQPSAINHIIDNPDYEPWRESALKRGYQSSIAIPLIDNDEVFAVLNIYASEQDVFEEEETKLLVELSETCRTV